MAAADLARSETVDAGSADTVDSGHASTVASTPPPNGPSGPVALPAPYQFRRELSRGGMGRVLIAWDARHGREVAIKLVRDAAPALLARFQREAQVTARLQHPAIVPVYASGTLADGEPFYVMRYVSGRSLDAVVETLPSPAARLGLLPQLIAAVDAIAYAHDRGVVHRDLKPQNILVGSFGETVVIDWGLAKDLAAEALATAFATPGGPPVRGAPPTDSGLTMAGAVMGTPGYMPPEQARGQEVDARADVYALGAVLYYVLAGGPAFSGRSSADVLAAVLHGPPPSLETRARGVPADLRAIVDKAMARDPAARYGSAAALAADLKKFQTGQLVGAHDYSLLERLRRFTRRQRTPVVVSLVLLTAIVALSVVYTRRITRERDTANARRAEAQAAREAADHLNGYLIAELAERLLRLGRLDLLKGIGQAVMQYEEQTARDDLNPRSARALELVGRAEGSRGDPVTGERALRRSFEIHQRLAATDREGRIARMRVERYWRDAVRQLKGVTAEVRAYAARADAFVAEGEGPARDAPELLDELASDLFTCASILHTIDERALQERALRGAIRLTDRAIALDSQSPAPRYNQARVRLELSAALRRDMRFDDATRESTQGLALFEQLSREQPEDLELRYRLADGFYSRSSLEEYRGDYRAATEFAARGVKLAEELVRSVPDHLDYQEVYEALLVQVAGVALDLGHYAEARQAMEKELAYLDGLTARHLPPGNAGYYRASALQSIGTSWVFTGHPARAIEPLARAVALLDEDRAGRENDVSADKALLDPLTFLGFARIRAGYPAEAIPVLQRAETIVARGLARDAKSEEWREAACYTYGWLGRALADAGRREEGRAALARGLAIATPLIDDPEIADSADALVAAAELASNAVEAFGDELAGARLVLVRSLPRLKRLAASGILQASAVEDLRKWARQAGGGRR